MTRVSELQLSRSLTNYSSIHRSTINRLNEDIASGIRVRDPGDSPVAATIALMQQNISKVDGYTDIISTSKGLLDFQTNVLDQASDLLVRAKEIANQAANETLSPTNRAQMAEEVLQIRDHMVSLANSTYLGKYVYNGTADSTPPYSKAAAYSQPSTGGPLTDRYLYDDTTPGTTGSAALKTVNVTDNLTLTINTPGNLIFDGSIHALEQLSRALGGYQTTLASGIPTGAGAAYSFPTDYNLQTQDIKSALDAIDNESKNVILPERVDVAGRLRRIDTAKALLDLTKTSSQDTLDTLQNTDIYSAATDLTQAQTALQASLKVGTSVLKLSILDYI